MGGVCSIPCPGQRVVGVSGEEVCVRQIPDRHKLRQQLQVRGPAAHQGAAEAHDQSMLLPARTCQTLVLHAHYQYCMPDWQLCAACAQLVRMLPFVGVSATALSLTPRCSAGVQAVLDAGISSIAVVLKHAAIYPEHERLVGQLATQMGFKQVSRWEGGKKPSTGE